jgi:hypothetical protein
MTGSAARHVSVDIHGEPNETSAKEMVERRTEMKTKTSILGIALLSLVAATGASLSPAQAGDHGRSGYRSNHGGGYERQGYRERRGHVRNRWAAARWFKNARRGHGHGSRH